MVKACTGPIYGRVADGTVQRKTSLLVIRAGGAVVQRNMARIAVFGCAGEWSAGMTLIALDGGVGSGQRERSLRVIEHGARPGGSRMALQTIRRESGQLMVGVRRAVVQRDMASATGSWRIGERSAGMALGTLQRGVGAG